MLIEWVRLNGQQQAVNLWRFHARGFDSLRPHRQQLAKRLYGVNRN